HGRFPGQGSSPLRCQRPRRYQRHRLPSAGRRLQLRSRQLLRRRVPVAGRFHRCSRLRRNTVDFSAQINDVLGTPADVIYFSGFCAEGAALVPALRAAGFDQQIIGADASDDSQCPVGGGPAFDGFIFTGFGGADVLSGEAATRASAFATEFRVVFPDATDFNGFTLSGADTLNVMVEAVRVAGSTE